MESKKIGFAGHLFKLGDAKLVAEGTGDYMVYKTPSSNYFLYDEGEHEIRAAFIQGDHDHHETSFAEALAQHGFADVVVEHFPDEAEGVLPEA